MDHWYIYLINMIFYLIIKFSQILDVSVTIYLYMKNNTSQQTISFWILLKCYIVPNKNQYNYT